jgi:adenosylhomocysteine nucleosidase
VTRTAIVSALREELAAVLELMPDEQRTVVAGREFWRGHLHGYEVVAALSGIGKVAAATTATLLIERFKVDDVLFTGVAGGLAPDVRVGDLVVAGEFLQHDMDASPLFPRYEIPGTGLARLPADAALTATLMRAARATLAELPQRLPPDVREAFGLQAPRLHQGLLVSGDRFVASTAESRALQQALPEALAVEMEGAAFAQVCRDFGVPLAVVRTVSDRADDAAHVDFPRFLRGVASPYSAAVLEHFFKTLAI